jgi:DNA invertase Pin-like site-specific DNA recombinase
MNTKIRSIHLERKAVVYLRQSSVRQVRDHRESTSRQYGLRERALQLGWSADAIEVIDDDLGQSGSSTESRRGFQRLAENVAHGRIGGLFALEVSRLARSSADWHRLLELAGLADVVIGDEDVVYDPHDYNDRLLLGLKGQFADAELYWMRLRLHGGRLSKARRGEFVFSPPTGYVWGDDQRLRLDPDEGVQRCMRLIFERFRLEKSGRAVVRYFRELGLQMPVRDRSTGELSWTAPRYHLVLCALKNPLYTGAYVYGRREQRMALVDGQRRIRRLVLPQDSWKVCKRDQHPAYVSWEEFMANQEKVRHNAAALRRREPDRHGAAREGEALLQGLILCGRCGRRMSPRYFSRIPPQYTCLDVDRVSRCFVAAVRPIDEVVAKLFLGVIQPAEIDLSLALTRDAEKQAHEIARQRKLRLENARYEVRLAERRYKSVDPDNRTVARTLEREWNDKLEELTGLERQYEAVRRREKVELSEQDRQQILLLARDLPRVWNAQSTTAAERKNLLRMLIREVSIKPVDVPERVTRIQVLWVTGATSEAQIPRYAPGESRTPRDSLKMLRELCTQNLSDAAIAERLNAMDLTPSRSARWNAHGVSHTRYRHAIAKAPAPGPGPIPSKREDGLYSIRGVADLLGMSIAGVHGWLAKGIISPTARGPNRSYWFRLEPAEVKRLRSLRNPPRGGRRKKTKLATGVHCG